MRVLVTGGCGFIGSAVVRFLLPVVEEVVVLDSLITGLRSNLPSHHPKLRVYLGQMEDMELLQTILKTHRITHVSCQAALGSVPRSLRDPWSSHQSNVHAFVTLLVAAKQCGVRRIVYASSSAIYGYSKSERNAQGHMDPRSVYALTKYVDEVYAKMWYSVFGIECIGLRYHNVFGERQRLLGAEYSAVLPKLVDCALSGTRFGIYGDGEQRRDFTHVDNAVYANWLALTTTNVNAYGHAFDIGLGESRDIHELVDAVQTVAGSSIKCISLHARPGDVRYSCAHITPAKEVLGYDLIVGFEEGIRRVVRYRSMVGFVDRENHVRRFLDRLRTIVKKTWSTISNSGFWRCWRKSES